LATLGTLFAAPVSASPLSLLYGTSDESHFGVNGPLIEEMSDSPYLRFGIQETTYGSSNGYTSSSLDWDLRPVGEAQTYYEEYGEDYAIFSFWRTYHRALEPDKEVTFSIDLQYMAKGLEGNAVNGPVVLVTTMATWWNGAPVKSPYLDGPPISKLGLVVRSDHDVSGANNSGFEAAWSFHGMLSAHDYGATMHDSVQQWPNIAQQPLARFFDTEYRTKYAAGAPVVEIQWLRGFDLNQRYGLRASRYDDDLVYYWMTPANLPAQMSTEPPTIYYPRYVPPGAGSDQVAYMYVEDPSPLQDTLEDLRVDNLVIKRDRHRTIEFKWFFHDGIYGNHLYRADDGKTVLDVLKSLDQFGSPVYLRRKQVTLKCPGNECSEGELLDLEAAVNPDSGLDKSVLKTAVYVLERNQTFPGAGGVVFPAKSRAFVFPKGMANIDKAVYSAIAHEVGHTFKFEHSWSTCKYDQTCKQGASIVPYCCAGGDLMSYAHVLAVQQGWDKYTFGYSADSRRWFNEASWPMVEPYVGGCAGAAFPDNNNGLEPGTVLGW
jgi:hypothetical protein